MRLAEAIDIIESCVTVEELRTRLHRIIQDYGFANFAFVDLATTGDADPFVLATTDAAWDSEYRTHGFVHVDPVLAVVRRANAPFTWADVKLPLSLGRRKPGALKLMEAARDHGLTEGYVVPFHYVDTIGRSHSASCVLFWKSAVLAFRRIPRQHKTDLHILMIYWAQRLLEIAARERLRKSRLLPLGEPILPLTDRERGVLGWASRGKTMAETALILSISVETVETHTRSAMRKLQASNKTQAVAIAIRLGLIDV